MLARLDRRLLFRDYNLEHEIVIHGHARRGIHVAQGRRLHARVAGCRELTFNLSTVAVEVGLPAGLQVAAADRAGLFVEDALPFAAQTMGVLGAGRGNHATVLVDAPLHFPDTPPPVHVFDGGVHHARQAHLHIELADRVDDTRKGHGCGEIGGWEDSDGVFVYSRHEGSLNDQVAGHGDRVGERRVRAGFEEVIDRSQFAMRRRGEMSREEIGKGKGVSALLEPIRLGEEIPGEEGRRLGPALGTILGHGFPRGDPGDQVHGELLQGDIGIRDGEEELTGQQRSGRLLRSAVEDEGR